MPLFDFATAPTLVQHLRSRAQTVPQREVFKFSDEPGLHASLTYGQLDHEARRLAAYLQSLGMPGKRAVLMHAPGPDYVLALLGCFYAGVVAVPAYPPRFNRPMERLRDLVADADASLVLTTDSALSRMQAHITQDAALSRMTWRATDHLPAEVSADDWREPGIDSDALALLQYTSGSTSAPKGVMITHGHFRNNVLSMAQALAATPEDRMVTWLPPYHDMGLVGGIFGPMFLGISTLVLTPSAFLQRPLRWLSAIAEHRATISGAPNFGYELCVRRVTETQREQLDLRSWRVAFCGAERVRAATLQQFAQHFAVSGFAAEAFAPCYGLAEATLGVSISTGGLKFANSDTRQPIDAPDIPVAGEAAQRISVSCGNAFPDMRIAVVDAATRRVLPAGEVGELWVQSNSVARGYWNQPELSAYTFAAQLADGEPGTFLRTGDLGFMQQDQLHVLARIKDLIIIRGVNVYPEDIEALVERAHADLRPAGAVAFSVEHEGEEHLVVVQELNPGARDAPLAEIAQQIRQNIVEALQLVVRQVVLVAPGVVPRTSSGKVQRGRCRTLYLSGQLEVVHDSAMTQPVLAQAPPELVAQIAGLMADLLSIETVMPDDDFFWLGGHSLLATQLMSRLRTVFAVELPLRAIFESPTPRLLAAQVSAQPLSRIKPDIKVVPRSGRLPLTFSQERMWLLQQMDPAGTAYNVAGAVQISGPVDFSRLAQAFNHVVRAHEILRTRYPSINGEANVQVIESAAVEVRFVDVSDVSEPMQAALARATQMARRPFDIANETLLRVSLFRIGADCHVLAVCMHHLITDAWSMGILVRDLLTCYDTLASDSVVNLPMPAFGYIDYAHWQREFMSGARIQVQLDYWKQQLQGAEAIELPTDHPRRRQRSSAGDLEPLLLPNELMTAIGALAATHNATPFMVLLAAFEALLFRWTARTDLVVGVPVANRNWQESEQLMGTLVNTLPVRIVFSESATFTQLLHEVRQRALDAYANQDLPFEKLIADLQLERKAGVTPLISVMFDYQNAPMPGRSVGDIVMKPLFLSRGSAQFDLSLLILDTEFGRIAGMEYSTDLFTADTIRRLLAQYLSLLEAAVAHPDTAIDRLPMLSTAERQRLLAHAQRTCHADVQIMPLIERIEERCVSDALRLAVQDEQVAWTYAQLQQRVQQLAARLTALGVAPGERVAVCLERSVDLVAALLAVLRCGAAYVPLDPHHPRDRLRYVLADAQPQLLLTHEHLSDLCEPADSLRVVCIETWPMSASIIATPIASCDESLPAYVIYTSGSTGRPKGVAVSRRALANFIQSMQRAPGITADDRLLSVTTIAFDIAGLELYLPLIAGGCAYIAGNEVIADGTRLMQLMKTWQANFMQATPATWKMLIEAGWRGHSRLKILCGGEAFPRELAEQLIHRAGSVWNMYGPTETTIWSAVHKVNRGKDTLVPIGAPIDETSIYILDRHQQLVPNGVPGEIWIGGIGVANGYYQRPELTVERFWPDPFMPADMPMHARMYRTGDAGRLRADGLLEHLGRLDDQIKIRGFRIEPGEIEQILKEHVGVQDAVVVAREVRPGDMRLLAYYVPVDRQRVSGLPTAELLEPLRRKLPAYMIPTAFVSMPALPTTPNGKIDRRALPMPELDMGSDAEYVAPRNELESRLCALWQELLKAPRVGIRDNFFMLGGHSLLAVRLFARIEKEFNASVPLATLFERPTIEFLAEALQQLQPNAPSAVKATVNTWSGNPALQFLVPIQREGSNPPLFCVHGAGGNVLNLWALSQHLGANQPFYGVQARGVDGCTPPMTDIHEMAQAYLHEIRRVQPNGPYYLSGYCAGGWVALEIARRLQLEGEKVALLALLDCYHPRLQPVAAPLSNFIKGLRQQGWSYLLHKALDSAQRYVFEASYHLRIAMQRLIGKPLPIELREFWLIAAMTAASRRYHPQAYRGDTIMMRAMDADRVRDDVGEHMGWDGVITGNVTVIDVAGDHHSMAHNHVIDLASRLHAEIASRSADFGLALRTGMMMVDNPESFR